MEIHCKNYEEKKYSIGRDIHNFAQILQLPGNNSKNKKKVLRTGIEPVASGYQLRNW